ncbi:MAG: DUF3558 domain-containing protein, partial [Mycobacterium sp.]
MRLLLALAGLLVAVGAGCGSAPEPATPSAAPVAAGGFHSGECNLVSDDEVKRAMHSSVAFNKVVDNDAGCFWQEDSMLGSVGA